MSVHRRLLSLFSILVILSMLFSGFSPVSAQQGGDGIERQVNTQTGKISFLGPQDGQFVAGSQALGKVTRPEDPALALAERFGPEFGLRDPRQELTSLKSSRAEDGRITARYQQNYEGVPVLGGELVVNTNDNGDLYSMNGEVSANLSLSTQPTISAEQARQTALQSVAKWNQKSAGDFTTSEPQLWIYDASLLRASTRPVELVWRMDVTPVNSVLPVRELVLVNAQRGNISLHFNQIDTAWNAPRGAQPSRENAAPVQPDASASALLDDPAIPVVQRVKTYTANNGTNLPGTLLCDQTQPNCTNGANPHADAAHRYAMGTNALYANQHDRNSINNAGMFIISSVHYDVNYDNANWTGTQMIYGDAVGYPLADDVVAHELTHGVTQYESNLFYYYQSGAINEAFSDLWGEFYDQTNGQGTDTAGVKWLMGEDISGAGALRSMSDPTSFGDPDRMSSFNYNASDSDNGGVHSNSGINNKAVYLMVEGGTFNGKTITALGWVKTAAIYYRATANLLTSGADYSDLYFALQTACSQLIGQKGITSADCLEVKDAIDAVEMSAQPVAGFNTDAPLCPAGSLPGSTLFADNLEGGLGNWTFSSTPLPQHWQLDSAFYGPYAQSGLHSLYADDFPDQPTHASARLRNLVIPANAYLWFAQSYGFESDGGGYYDGGVLEYSINNGASWADAGSMIEVNGYDGVLFTGSNNPLSGRSAFVGDSHGYISTRLNLAARAGQTVSFRWRLGLDQVAYDYGWWVDNIKLYTCRPLPGAFNKTSPANGASGVSLNPTLSWSSSPFATSYQYCYDLINDNQCNSTWKSAAGTSVPITNLGPNTTFYWQVRAVNAVGMTEADSASWRSFSTTSTLGGATGVNVFVGSPRYGSFSLSNGQSLRESFTGVSNGPVELTSTTALPLIGAERVVYKVNNVNTSYIELMGLPDSQVDNTYWLPWYNNVEMDTQLRIANVSNSSATVTVTIGGVAKPGINLSVGESTRVSYAGVNAGPVQIVSNQNIVVTERVVYKVLGINTSYSEMNALPDSQLDTTYWLPWYNNVDLNTQLRIANVSGSPATITVTIGGVAKPPINLAAGDSARVSYAGVNAGPVQVTSTQPIVVAERVIYTVAGKQTSFTEMMALPDNQVDITYWLPWYNNTDLDTQLRIGNVSSSPATVHVFVGGAEVTPLAGISLPVGGSTRLSYAGVNDGPVQIVSDQPIVAAERVIYKVNNVNTSFTEMMALPDSQLDTTYWFPWYNNTDLDTQLRFGVP